MALSGVQPAIIQDNKEFVSCVLLAKLNSIQGIFIYIYIYITNDYSVKNGTSHLRGTVQ
jgi:hypothetical protein